MAYLDDTGLAYFWGKIKAYVAALLAPKANDADVVHKAGNEVVNGIKTFNDYLNRKDSSFDTNTLVSSNTYSSLAEFHDANDISLADLYYGEETTGGTVFVMQVHNKAKTDTDRLSIRYFVDSNNNEYAVATGPTPPSSSNSYDLATTAWVRTFVDSTYLPLTGGTLTGSVFLKKLDIVRGTAPSANAELGFTVKDSNNVNLSALSTIYYTDKSSFTRFWAYDTTVASGNNIGYLGIGCDSSGNVYTAAPTPVTGDNSTKIATTAWVRTFGSNTYLPLTGGTLTGSLKFARNNITRGTAPSSDSVLSLANCVDSANNRISLIESSYYTDKSSKVALFAYNTTIASGNNIGSLGIGCTSAGNVYTFCPTPATSDDSTQIATTAFVKAQNYITSNDNAKGLNSRGSLGDNYEMSTASFDGVAFGIWGIGSFKANTTSVPYTGDVGDYGIIRLYTGSVNYSTYLLSSPRTDRLFFGKFWSGTFDTWHELYTNSHNLIFRGSANTISRPDDTDALFVCGGSSTTTSSYLLVCGKSDNAAGTFSVVAKKDSTSRTLKGTYNGNLTWNGQTIQTTSDARLKTSLDSIPDKILDAWDEINWGQFKFLDAVSEKGEHARLHIGLISQQVQDIFSKHNLDACDYGFICHEVQNAIDRIHVVDTINEYTDENGVVHPEQKITELRHEDAIDLWMIRYTEALCMEAAYQRRENVRLKKRISDLEDRLAALELRLGSE